jgi:hypothetical protein
MSHPHYRWAAILRALRSSYVHASLRRTARRRVNPQCSPLERLEDRAVPSVITLLVKSLADSGGRTLRLAIATVDPGPANDSYVPAGG